MRTSQPTEVVLSGGSNHTNLVRVNGEEELASSTRAQQLARTMVKDDRNSSGAATRFRSLRKQKGNTAKVFQSRTHKKRARAILPPTRLSMKRGISRLQGPDSRRTADKPPGQPQENFPHIRQPANR